MFNSPAVISLLAMAACAVPLHGAPDSTRLLTLDQALEIALAQNPDVAEARSRLDESEARLRAAQAGAWPTLKARGVYDYWSEDQRAFPASRNGEPGAFGSQALGAEIVASVPLYAGGRITGEKEAADWDRRSAEDQFYRMQELLVYQVTVQYYGLLAQDEVLRALEAAVRAMDEQQRAIEDLVAAEKAARVDLLRTHVQRAELYERQVRETHNRTVQQRAWAALLGLDDATAPAAEGPLELRHFPDSPLASVCMQRAFEQRADFRAAHAAVYAADASVRAARSGRRPQLSAQAAYGVRWLPNASEEPDDAVVQQDVGRVGLVAELPLFDGDLADARVAEQQARRRIARERLRKLELQIRFEVETALSDMMTARERVQTARQAVGQAEESFRIMKDKLDLDKGTLNDILDAQQALVSAQTSLARSLADLSVAEARMNLAVGDILPSSAIRN